MKKISSLLTILIFATASLAQKSNILSSGGTAFVKGNSLLQITNQQPHIDTVFIFGIRTKEGMKIPGDSLILEENQLVLGLYNGFKTNASIDIVFDSLLVRVKLKYLINRDTLYKTEWFKIRNQNNRQLAKDQQFIPNVQWCIANIDSVKIFGLPANTIVSDSLFSFEMSIQGNAYYPVRKNMSGRVEEKFTEIPLPNPDIINGFAMINFPYHTWATSYDLEWAFIDKIDQPRTPDFKQNSTRINIKPNTIFDLPLVFPEGKIFYRIRANGKFINGDLYTGPWSAIKDIPIMENQAFENQKKAYQNISTFADDGKRKDLVSFFDGSGRNRQSNTRINTEPNTTITTESFYDHLGRPVISTLPTPIKIDPGKPITFTGENGSTKFDVLKKESSSTILSSLYKIDRLSTQYYSTNSSTSKQPAKPGSKPYEVIENGFHTGRYAQKKPTIEVDFNRNNENTSSNWPAIIAYQDQRAALNFKPNFNLNLQEKPYSRADFDLEQPECSPEMAAKMSTSSGAGKYYSSNNDLTGVNMDFVPDAEGLPFIQSVFKKDHTGRIEATGLAGQPLSIGSQHETKYTYASPAQDELNRVFGNDIGIASNYLKKVTTDPNGQSSITYTNSDGQVIANALAGFSPSSLDSLYRVDAPIVERVASPSFRSGDNFTLVSKTITIENDRTPIQVKYDLEPGKWIAQIPCNIISTFCYDCQRNLTLTIKDDCNRTLLSKSISLGTTNDSQADRITICNNQAFNIDTIILAKKGVLHINKKLEVEANKRDEYINHYIKLDTACYRPVVDTPGCNSTLRCKPCEYKDSMVTINGFSVKIFIRKPGNNPNCSRKCMDSKSTWAVDDYERILGDMKPGGLYGAIHPFDTFGGKNYKLSIFNTINLLRNTPVDRSFLFKFRYNNPVFPYKNEDGSDAFIPINNLEITDYNLEHIETIDGIQKIRPQYINDMHKLQAIWRDSWTESLLAYHPEYAYFEWNNENYKSQLYIDSLNNMTASTAYGNGYINNECDLTSIINNDPFFIFHPGYKEPFKRILTEMPGNMNIIKVVKREIKCALYERTRDRELTEDEEQQEQVCIEGVNISGFSPIEWEDAWGLFRNIYISKKEIFIDSIRNATLLSPIIISEPTERERARSRYNRFAGRLTNRCIGESMGRCTCDITSVTGIDREFRDSIKLYGKRRFVSPWCMSDVERTLAHTDIEGREVPEQNPNIEIFRQIESWQNCSGTCIITFDFMVWLNSLTKAPLGGLSSSTIPIMLPRFRPTINLINLFSGDRSSGYYYSSQGAGTNQLKIKIVSTNNRANLLDFTLRSTSNNTNWQNINFLSCLTVFNGVYSLKATHRNGLKDSIVVTGTIVSSFDLSACSSYVAGGNTFDPRILSTNRNTFYERLLKSKDPKTYPTPAPAICCISPSPVFTLLPVCDTYISSTVASLVQAKKEARARYLYDSLTLVYNRKCLSSISESLTLTYSAPIYHYTLYYYDQSGHLIKTLPPKAVHPIQDQATLDNINTARTNNTAGVYPSHNEALATTYTYNSFGQKKTRKTPDNGTTRWIYDEVGRSIMEISDQHKADDVIAYNIYDEKSRPVENGYVKGITLGPNIISAPIMKYENYKNLINFSPRKLEVARTIYDERQGDADVQNRLLPGGQSHLRNRVSAILYRDSLAPTDRVYDHAMYFNYDIAGNMREVLMDYKALSNILSGTTMSSDPRTDYFSNQLINDHEKKLIRYQYDQITSKVTEVAYQPDRPDQFYHWYSYDADNRLTKVETGRSRFEPEQWRERDISYKYYLHGPVARAELGTENIQAIDMAYTLNGWLKQVNSPSRNQTLDPGMDNLTNTGFLPDAFGYQLSYFNNDYKPIGFNGLGDNDAIAGNAELFNGNIRRSIMRNDFLAGTPGGDITAQLYRYDQANRLVDFKFADYENKPENNLDASNAMIPFYNLNNSIWNITDKYRMSLTYDPNGNIKTLTRKDGEARAFDQLTYHYANDNNKLDHITDVGDTRNTTIKDLVNQNPSNYKYDHAGRLIQDNMSKEEHTMSWTHRDKLKQFSPSVGTASIFRYDALGRRVIKKSGDLTTYTVRDFTGNIMAVYEIKSNKKSNTNQITLTEIPINSSGSRIGSWNTALSLTDKNMSLPDTSHITLIRGEKLYECKNQTGDILALISDRRQLQTSEDDAATYTPDIVQATDYYPFGMEMPGRKMGTKRYRYGFQGMEQDDDLKGDGNSISTEFRQYDPRVGRWKSVDPKAKYFSSINPYNSFYNNPIFYVDPKGDIAPWILGGLYGLGAGIASEIVASQMDPNYNFDWSAVGRLGISTGVGIATAGLGVSALGAKVAWDMGSNVASQYISTGTVNLGETAITGIFSAATNGILGGEHIGNHAPGGVSIATSAITQLIGCSIGNANKEEEKIKKALAGSSEKPSSSGSIEKPSSPSIPAVNSENETSQASSNESAVSETPSSNTSSGNTLQTGSQTDPSLFLSECVKRITNDPKRLQTVQNLGLTPLDACGNLTRYAQSVQGGRIVAPGDAHLVPIPEPKN